MERSRVEDLKNKFECLQNQSAVKNNVNKPPLNHKKLCNNNSLTVVSNSSKSNGDSLNVKVSNTSNFVGRGNIKRSHAFRADKPISRNFSNFGSDLPLSSDPSRENVYCDSQEIRLSSVKGSPELKTDGILFDSRFKKQGAKERDFKSSNLPNNSLLSNNQKCHLDSVSPTSKYSKRSFDKHKDETEAEDRLRTCPIIKDTYSTVVKSCKNLPVSSVSVNDSVNLCDTTSANFKNINVDSNYKSKNSDTSLKVKSMVKTVEQKNIKKLSTEKIKSTKSSHRHKTTNDTVITNDNLSNTLKAALSAPLPIGPPPKKPPRTFAHSLSNSCDDSTMKKQNVLKTDSSSGLKQTSDASLVVTNKPVRSKTESQIMLKKLENYLLSHQQNSLSVNSGSSMNDKSCNSNEMIDESKPVKLEKQQLVSVGESKNKEMIKRDVKSNTEKMNHRSAVSHRQLISSSNTNNSSNCFNSLNCTRQPIYASPIEKQSNFFVTIPKQSSVETIDNDFVSKPSVEFRSSSYGTIKRSASVEHIYAEPETTENDVLSSNHKRNSMKFKCATISERRGKLAGMCSRPQLSPLMNNFDSSRSTVQLLKTNFESPAGSKELIDQESGALQYGLHYMCTPISDASCSNNSSKKDNINSGLFTSHVNSAGDFLSEAINTNVRLNPPSFSLTSNCNNSNNNATEKCDNAERLLSLSLVSDCTQPRRIRVFSSSSEVGGQEIDKQRIHQLLSEAYGKIKHKKNSNIMLSSGRKTSSSGDIASGSDSDGSSVISSPDDPNQSFLLQPSSSSVISPTVASGGAMSIRSAKDREQITAERKGYVRRVSSRLTSIRQSPNLNPDRFSHLFECLILVGLDLNSAHCKVPYIKSKFPENISSPPGIESLCFPDADDWPPEPDSGQSYIQILTDSNGIRKYSYCRRVQPEDAAICLPLVYCIITPYKSNSFYDKILVDLESRHGHQSDGELSKFIHQLYNCHFPAPGQTFSIRQHINSSESSIIDVYQRPFDPREEDNELAKLLTIIKLSIFLQIFATLLHERKVILVSDSISKLSICIEGLQSALYPFFWQHTVVPILPSMLMDVCEAPTPYLIGIIKPKLSDLPLNSIDLDLVVDIDKDTILNSKGDEGWILPTRLSRGLRSALQLSIQESQSNINAANILASEAIMRLFVEMIGHYRDHILVASDTRKREFQRDSFVRNGASRSIQLFLEWFTETAMFNAFIESRLERTSESRGMFEQRCSEYIEENEMTHPLMKKAINKTVKSLGDRFKDWAALS